MYTQETSQIYQTIAAGAAGLAVTFSVIVWFAIRYFTRITDDIRNLYDLHGQLPCDKNNREIGEISKEIEWLKRGKKDD